MFYVLSKLVEQFVIPSNAFLLLGVVGIVLIMFQWRRLGLTCSIGSILLLAVFGWTPVGTLALSRLENRFPVPVLSTPPTGFIMLGGAVDIHLSTDRGTGSINDAGERVTEIAALSRRFPTARVFLSGGLGHLTHGDDLKSESEAARDMLVAIGVAPERISMEENSRTTCENATESFKALAPKAGETWLLVTSGWHMPRAVGCFRAAGFDVVAYPVDFRTRATLNWRPVSRSAEEGLEEADVAAHEWIGLATYWMTGKIADILPAP